MSDDPRPQAPEKPAPDECCGGGCAPCVLETYEEARSEYQARLIEWYGRNPPRQNPQKAEHERTRLVLDTNVSLDLFVFRDPRCETLLRMMYEGDCEVVVDAACRQEFSRVLAYPQLKLSLSARVNTVEVFDQMCRFVGTDALPDSANTELPRCADPDDQKFLQLALRSGADVLLSRDDAVLQLARRMRGTDLFTIATPQDWLSRNALQRD